MAAGDNPPPAEGMRSGAGAAVPGTPRPRRRLVPRRRRGDVPRHRGVPSEQEQARGRPPLAAGESRGGGSPALLPWRVGHHLAGQVRVGDAAAAEAGLYETTRGLPLITTPTSCCRGVPEDETDGHVDNLAVFAQVWSGVVPLCSAGRGDVGATGVCMPGVLKSMLGFALLIRRMARPIPQPGVVLLAWTDDETNPLRPVCLDAERRLLAARDARGRRLTVRRLVVPIAPLLMTAVEAEGLRTQGGTQPRYAGTAPVTHTHTHANNNDVQ